MPGCPVLGDRGIAPGHSRLAEVHVQRPGRDETRVELRRPCSVALDALAREPAQELGARMGVARSQRRSREAREPRDEARPRPQRERPGGVGQEADALEQRGR